MLPGQAALALVGMGDGLVQRGDAQARVLRGQTQRQT